MGTLNEGQRYIEQALGFYWHLKLGTLWLFDKVFSYTICNVLSKDKAWTIIYCPALEHTFATGSQTNCSTIVLLCVSKALFQGFFYSTTFTWNIIVYATTSVLCSGSVVTLEKKPKTHKSPDAFAACHDRDILYPNLYPSAKPFPPFTKCTLASWCYGS